MMNQTQAEKLRAEGYVPAREASELAGVDIATVYRWADDGKVDGLQMGRHRYVLYASLLTYLGPHAVRVLKLPKKPPLS